MNKGDSCRACGGLLASDHADVDRTGQMLCFSCEERYGVQPLVARFWHLVDGGWVKLTLHVRVDFPRERFYHLDDHAFFAAEEAHDTGAVHLQAYTSHDEGGSRRCESLWLEEDGIVHYQVSVNSRDCDGATSWEQDLTCHVSRLAARAPYVPEPGCGDPADYRPEPGAMLPDWETRRQAQRDLAAERMGY